MDKNTIIPADLPLSTNAKRLRKAWQDAEDKLTAYRQENAQYAPRRTLNALDQYVSHVPAISEAEKELKAAEIEAVANGKPLPDRDAMLRPIKAKADEYPRVVSALKVLAEKAHNAFVEAVRDDLVPMGQKQARAAQKAREEWEKAYNAAMAARKTLEKHAARFTWCATAGDVDTLPLEGASDGSKAEYWELSADGRLTTEAAIALGYEGIGVIDGLIVMPEPVKDEQAEAEAEFWRNYKPKMFIAKTDGYTNWEH